MRAHLPSWVTGALCAGLAGLLTLPSWGRPPSPARMTTYPSAARMTPGVYPPTEPYRASFYFPKEPPARPRPEQVRDVHLFDNYYSPSLLYISSGMTVRWTNRGRHHHTVTCNWLWESGELTKGESFSLTFTRPGTYYYYCRLHSRTMRGKIIVS